jgi:hypothetical protein
MNYEVLAVLAGLALFAVMVAALMVGRRIGRRRLAEDPGAANSGQGAIDAAVFGLFGLLVAFTFSGAGARFDDRRSLIVAEANAIGTAWLRLDILPADVQPGLRQQFRDYVDARIDTLVLLPDLDASRAAMHRAGALQAEIWRAATAAVQRPGLSPAVATLMLPSLNEMFDIATTRRMATERHPPLAVWAMFGLLAVASAVLAGQGMARDRNPSLMHLLGFPAVLALVVALTLNLEHPRLGLITLTGFDQAIVDVRAGME